MLTKEIIGQARKDWEAGLKINAVKEIRAALEIGLKPALDWCRTMFDGEPPSDFLAASCRAPICIDDQAPFHGPTLPYYMRWIDDSFCFAFEEV